MSATLSNADVAEQSARFVFEELIRTEEQYVKDLTSGFERYSGIFKCTVSLPVNLKGKEDVLLGNVADIAALHRVRILPLMHQYRHKLELLFERWQSLIERDYFYCYVLFVGNQRASIKLYHENELYFKRLQIKMGDPLGIRSFLLKPVQRVTKYPLLLNRFLQAFFENRRVISKRVFEVACRLEKRLRQLLDRANQLDQINDVEHINVHVLLRMQRFITASNLQLIDGRWRCSYNGKLFAFNTSLIYTEEKGGKQRLRGIFELPDVCIVAKTKSFVLCNKQGECEFLCSPAEVRKWQSTVRQLVERLYAGPASRDRPSMEGGSIIVEPKGAKRGPVSRAIWYAT